MSASTTRTTRRTFLQAAAGAAANLAPAVHGAGAASRARPNVLFIICDDLNDSVEGMGGHPQARTPHIHRLMERGIQFTNAHNNQPWCAPSRASLWSGLYPFTTGYHGRGHWRDHPVLAGTVTLIEHLRRSGYAVYGTGKLFHNGHEPKDLYTQYGHDPDFGPWPWDGKESTRVPLVIATPELRAGGQQCDRPVSLIDLYPTIAELCGLPPEPNAPGNRRRLDGHSLRPFLDNPRSGAWDGPAVAVTQLGAADKAHYSVRGRRWRYTLCSNGEEELYDHTADPHEWNNLAADPKFAAVKADLKRQLLRITGKAPANP
jgi:arylsulfatase A-like enzyme